MNLRKDHYHTDPRSFLTVNLSGCLLLLLGLNFVFGLGGVGFRLSIGVDWQFLVRFQYYYYYFDDDDDVEGALGVCWLVPRTKSFLKAGSGLCCLLLYFTTITGRDRRTLKREGIVAANVVE